MIVTGRVGHSPCAGRVAGAYGSVPAISVTRVAGAVLTGLSSVCSGAAGRQAARSADAMTMQRNATGNLRLIFHIMPIADENDNCRSPMGHGNQFSCEGKTKIGGLWSPGVRTVRWDYNAGAAGGKGLARVLP